MAVRNYNITARLSGDPTAAGASGLTPAWVFFDTEAGAPIAAPTFTNPGGKGIYRFQYDAIASGEAVGIVDFGSGFSDPNERYADVVVTLDGALIQANLDAQVSTRLAASGYTAPDNADVVTSLADLVTLLGRADPTTALAGLTTAVTAIKAKTDALLTLVSGTVTGVPTALALTASGSLSSTDNAYKNGYVLFLTGASAGIVPLPVSSYVGATRTFSFAAPGLTVAPALGDTFVILGSKN